MYLRILVAQNMMKCEHTTNTDKIQQDDIYWDFQYYRLSDVRMIKYRVKIIDKEIIHDRR